MNGYNALFTLIHWGILFIILIITALPLQEFVDSLYKKGKLVWRIKAVCSPILFGLNGLILIGFNEDIITGFAGLVVECIALICLGMFFAYVFFIKNNNISQE